MLARGSTELNKVELEKKAVLGLASQSGIIDWGHIARDAYRVAYSASRTAGSYTSRRATRPIFFYINPYTHPRGAGRLSRESRQVHVSVSSSSRLFVKYLRITYPMRHILVLINITMT